MDEPTDYAGRPCPFCRFPIKPGAAIARCVSCGAVHHADCWVDNGGCAVVGCQGAPMADQSAGREGTPRPREQLAQARVEPATGGVAETSLRLTSPIVVAAAVAGLVLAGAAVAIVAVSVAGHQSNSRTVVTVGGVTDTTSTAPGANGESATAPAPEAEVELFRGGEFSTQVPRGWTRVATEVRHGPETETKWVNPASASDYILIDSHTPTHLTPEADANPVHADAEREASYEQISYEPGDLKGSPSWRWVFESEGLRKLDYFFEACGHTFGVIGAATPGEFSIREVTYRDAAQSVIDGCR